MILNIYVPATDNLHGILPGSAIVGSPSPDPADGDYVNGDYEGMIRLDYEGGRYGQQEFESIHHRLLHAADRHTWNDGRGYPTVARVWLKRSDVRVVGTYDTSTWRVVYITDQAAFDAWTARYGQS